VPFFSGISFDSSYAYQQGDWPNAGFNFEPYLAGGVSDRAVSGTVINVTSAPYNADNTGATNCKAAVQAAMAAAVSGDVVYFPAGTYLFSEGFIYTEYKDNITIRGAGPTVTTLHCSTGNPIFVWSAPGDFSSNRQVVTGTKTKGTTVLNVTSSAGYSDGQLVQVTYENEVDTTRIIAGAPPIWTSGGFAGARNMLSRVVSTTSNTITINPGLPADGTNLEVAISDGALNWYTQGVGMEDFSVTFDIADHPSQFANVQHAANCWFYNIHFEDFSRNQSNGSCIKIAYSYYCEIRKNEFRALTVGVTSDGAIETGSNVGLAILDNIFFGKFDNAIYESGNSNNTVIAYNYVDTGYLSIFHNAHPALNLVEGNAGPTHQSDGYHGSSSNNTFFRNYFTGGFSLILNRFKRQYFLGANLLGTDGVNPGNISYGNPNISNGAADGFAGPTGLSTQVGSVDYSQPGYGPNEYVIQPADVSVGDFWDDWEVTGTLTTRTSDTVGTFTVDGGDWFVGSSPTGASVILPTIYWSNKTAGMNGSLGSVTAVSGNLVTLTWILGTLPTEGTVCQMYFGAPGWQERDLDVQASTILTKNYWASGISVGEIRQGTAEVFPNSLKYATKPAWFGLLEFPPFDPEAPAFDVTRIPAGWRFTYGNEDYFTEVAVATPTFSPAAGEYYATQNVTISSLTVGATIRYTIDGSTPTASTGTVYSGPITIAATTTLKAIAYNGVLTDSSVRTGIFTISELPDVGNITANGTLFANTLTLA